MAVELFAGIGTVFSVESENEFDAMCAVTATIAAYFAFIGWGSTRDSRIEGPRLHRANVLGAHRFRR